MGAQNQQSGAGGKTEESDEWVPKANSVQVTPGARSDYGADIVVRTEKRLQSFAAADSRRRKDFLGGANFAFWRWFE